MGGVLEEVMGRLRLPTDLRAGPRKWEAPYPHPCPWNMCATCPLCSQRLPQGHKLEMEMWYWDPLNSIHNWSQLRPLYKLLGFRGECGNLFVLQTDPGDKPCKIPLFITTATYWSEVPCLFLPSLSVLCTQEQVSDDTWEAPEEVVNKQWGNSIWLMSVFSLYLCSWRTFCSLMMIKSYIWVWKTFAWNLSMQSNTFHDLVVLCLRGNMYMKYI